MFETIVMLAFVAIWAAVWWKVADWYGRRGEGAVIRHLTGLAAGGFSGVVFFVAATLIHSPSAEQPVAAVESSPPQNSEPEPPAPEMKPERPATLNIKPPEFRARYNAVNKKLGAIKTRPLPALKVEEGLAANVFQAKVTDIYSITGGVDKGTGQITGVLMVGGGAEAPEAARAIAAMISIVKAVDPSIPDKEVGKFVTDLMGRTKLDGGAVNQVRNGILYSINISSSTGFMFGAQAAEGE
jgi:hypothetical protein